MNEKTQPARSFYFPNDSEARILGHVVRNPGVSQPEIALATGLSQQSVSRLAKDLLQQGLLTRGQKQLSGRRGQPRMALEIVPDYAYSVGVALMTDAMSVLLIDLAGNIVDYEFVMMPSMAREAVFASLSTTLGGFLQKHHILAERVFGVGVGISGYNLDGRSRFNPPAHLEDWAMVEIDRLFEEKLNLPAWVENDGNAAAIGENLLGAGCHFENFVCVFIAAGIGGGIVVNRRLLRGVHGNGGELGLILPRKGFPRPTLETLLHQVRARGVGVENISDMIARFDPDWPGVDEWIEQTKGSLSLVLSSIAALLDPEAIVLGGRIPPALALKLIPALEVYDDARRSEPRPLPRIMLSETLVDACAIGASMLPFGQHFYSATF